MIKKSVLVGAVSLALFGAAALYFFKSEPEAPAHAFIAPTNQETVARGKVIYDNQCAACHGVNLEGQANWRQRLPNGRLPAPPHDASGHTWHHPDAVLIDIIKNGLVPGKTAPAGYESDMPAYGSVLSEDEIVAVLVYIKSDWPAEILAQQKTMTLQHNQK